MFLELPSEIWNHIIKNYYMNFRELYLYKKIKYIYSQMTAKINLIETDLLADKDDKYKLFVRTYAFSMNYEKYHIKYNTIQYDCIYQHNLIQDYGDSEIKSKHKIISFEDVKILMKLAILLHSKYPKIKTNGFIYYFTQNIEIIEHDLDNIKPYILEHYESCIYVIKSIKKDFEKLKKIYNILNDQRIKKYINSTYEKEISYLQWQYGSICF